MVNATSDINFSVILAGAPGPAGPSGPSLPTGAIIQWATRVAPSGFLIADGTAVSRGTYGALYSALNPSLGNPTISVANPAVITLTAHGLVAGDSFFLTTTGGLPTGINAAQRYYVLGSGITANTFTFSASYGGSAVVTSGSQTGSHTLYFSPYGNGDASTTFNLPNFSGRVAVGKNASDSSFSALGYLGGEATHILTSAEMPSHTHVQDPHFHSLSGIFIQNNVNYTGSGFNPLTNDARSGAVNATNAATATNQSTGGGGAHNNLQPYNTVYYLIKY